jgi:hypothetical protein
VKQIYTILIVLSVCFLNIYSQGISNKSVGEILDTKGVIKPNSSGSFNAEGYEMTYGNNKEPIFKKIDHSASVQTSTYGWGTIDSVRNGTNGYILAIAVDGSGNIYLGGNFTLVSDIPANHIAKWNGTTWSTLTSGSFNGVNNNVSAISISGSDVYVGGNFSFLGNGTTSAKGIAKWNSTTSTWSTLTSGASNGVGGGVGAIAISGSYVYVGGGFSLLGDGITSAYNIAKWNTTTSTWSTLTSGAFNGVLGAVCAIAIIGSDVYVGGSFPELGDGLTIAKYIAKWNTTSSTWSTLGSGSSNGVCVIVRAIAINGSDVYVGGDFYFLGNGTTLARGIAKWSSNTNSWSPLTSGSSNGLNNRVYTLAISGSDVYVGGDFAGLSNNTPVNFIAKWNTTTSTWSTLTSGASNGLSSSVYATAVSGSDVYVGGGFNLLGDFTTSANSIAKWNTTGSTWSTLTSVASNGVNNIVSAIAISGSDVYVGGYFTFTGDGGTLLNHIAKWNTTTKTWSILTSGAANGVNNNVSAIAISGNDVYVGGQFTLLANGTSANYIAKWNSNTSTWSTLTSGASNGVNGGVNAITISGSDVYVGGAFTLLGNGTTSAKYIAKWNTTTSTWSTLTSGASNGVNNYVNALAINGSDVYVGGYFTFLGNGTTSANYIAKWNTTTSSWSTLTSGASNGVNGGVKALAISGSDVYVGGVFNLLGNGTTSAKCIAKWNTTASTWSTLTSGASNGVNILVNAIATSGSDVYVGGYFTLLGDGTTSANCLAKWNGSNLSALDNGVNSEVYTMQVSPTEGKMLIGGNFTVLNGTTSAYYVGTFTDPGNALPVELSTFVSNIKGRDINLNWSTQTEKNSDKFNIERKTTGTDWGLIGSVKAAVLSNSPKQYSFTDKNLQSGKYQYRLKMIDNDGSFQYSQVVETEVGLPNSFALSQNYPNPFNPNTVILYSLPLASNVKLIVYNSLGQTVRVLENGFRNAGSYSVNLNASELSSGTYFYKIEAGPFSQIKKMMLLK